MTGHGTLLDRPTTDAAREIARGRLADAAVALDRLRDRKDTEALHDFRVAVRRLRSVLRAYRRWLGRAAARKVRRRFRSLAMTTNDGRDAEVQLTWLELQRPALARVERAGLNWLVRRRRTTKQEGYRAARRHVRADFRKAAAALERRLDALDTTHSPLRRTLAALLREHAADLEAKLAAIRGADDRERVHAARISAKRLRYLIEPLRDDEDALKPLVSRLKDLQDLLGDLHDTHVLDAELLAALETAAAEKAHRLRALALEGNDDAVQRERRRDERLGLVALAARAQDDRDGLFAALTERWLQDGGRGFFRDVADAAVAIEHPHDLPVERERKYLLRALPEATREATAVDIEQGWLPGDRLRERLRRTRDDLGDRFYRTVKLGAGVERIEIEEETTEAVFTAMWPLTDGCRIAKRRYRIPAGDLTWEIDDFPGRALVLAEVELPRPDTDVTLPEWLAPYVEKEVTGDPAYLNLTLASGGASPRRRSPTPGASRARRAAAATPSP